MTTDTATEGSSRAGFDVHLDNFEGPFDLLLSLISKHELEITEVALARVTDEFIATVMASDVEWELDGASEFLVVAATLLDLKAARLLPQGEVEDPEDLKALEARDLLFAKLLQYKAFKEVAFSFGVMLDAPPRVPRDVSLESHFAALLPELIWATDAETLATLAARVFGTRRDPAVSTTHLISPKVSVREQAVFVTALLQREKVMTFRSIVRDTRELGVIVARFLALLELFRESLVAFDQIRSLAELTVRWTGGDREVDLVTDFDREVGDG